MLCWCGQWYAAIVLQKYFSEFSGLARKIFSHQVQYLAVSAPLITVRPITAVRVKDALGSKQVPQTIQFYKRLFRRRGIFPAMLTGKAVLPDDHYHESYGEELMDYLEVIEADYRRADP